MEKWRGIIMTSDFHFIRMNNFMYVDTQTMAEKDYSTATKTFLKNYRKMSTPEPVQKNLDRIQLHMFRRS